MGSIEIFPIGRFSLVVWSFAALHHVWCFYLSIKWYRKSWSGPSWAYTWPRVAQSSSISPWPPSFSLSSGPQQSSSLSPWPPTASCARAISPSPAALQLLDSAPFTWNDPSCASTSNSISAAFLGPAATLASLDPTAPATPLAPRTGAPTCWQAQSAHPSFPELGYLATFSPYLSAYAFPDLNYPATFSLSALPCAAPKGQRQLASSAESRRKVYIYACDQGTGQMCWCTAITYSNTGISKKNLSSSRSSLLLHLGMWYVHVVQCACKNCSAQHNSQRRYDTILTYLNLHPQVQPPASHRQFTSLPSSQVFQQQKKLVKVASPFDCVWLFSFDRCLDRSGLTDQPIITGAQVPLAAKEASKLLKGEKAYTNTCISFYNAKGGEVRKSYWFLMLMHMSQIFYTAWLYALDVW